jgi:CHASE2 domain-containing sensor protein
MTVKYREEILLIINGFVIGINICFIMFFNTHWASFAAILLSAIAIFTILITRIGLQK